VHGPKEIGHGRSFGGRGFGWRWQMETETNSDYKTASGSRDET
jgi:hypothetical protein